MSNHYPPAIRVANYGDAKFRGWVHCVTDRWTADETPPLFLIRASEAQAFEDSQDRLARFSLIVATGKRFGTGRTEMGVWTSAEPGQMVVQHWKGLVPASAEVERLLTSRNGDGLHEHSTDFWLDFMRQRGLRFDAIERNGAFLQGRVESIHTEKGVRAQLWARFDPHTPELLFCETLVVAFGKTAEVEAAPQITGWHRVAYRGPEQAVSLADGQGVAASFTLVNLAFHKHLIDRDEMDIVMSNKVLAAGQIIAHATARVYTSGTGQGPGWPKELTPEQCVRWTNEHIVSEADALDLMVSAGKLGPAKDMSRTGAQEDQFFLGSESRLPGTEVPRELAAWGFARFPCQILNQHGRPVDPRLHDSLVFWMGRPHYSRAVSPDQLGRATWPNATECQGWTNPCDEEHWLINNLWVATMLRNSPVHQELLSFQARAWLLSCTTDRRLSTTRPGAARAVGYKCWVPWLLHHGLEDRALAEMVVSHAWKWLEVILPMIERRAINGWWDVRTNSPSLGAGRWVMPWQQALGAYGLWRLATLLGHSHAVAVAHRAAAVVCERAYYQPAGVGGRWRALYSLCIDDSQRDDKDDYSDFGCPLALPVVGAERPGSMHHEKWQQAVTFGSGRWTCPMTNQEVV